MALRDTDFRTISAALYAYAGTVVDERRADLVEARLQQMAKGRGLATIEVLVDALRDSSSPFASEVIDNLVNCETSFFRDARAFDALRDYVIPQAMRRRDPVRRLRILCAGCSTGQEPYSVAMVVREQFPQLARWSVEILGVDVSARRLERAESGLYSKHEIERGVPAPLIGKYFQVDKEQLRISAALRAITRFKRLNLVDRWQGLFGFDIILLRNVLIYLDDAAKSTMLDDAHRAMQAHGQLLLGAAETVPMTHQRFDRAPWNPYPVYVPRGQAGV